VRVFCCLILAVGRDGVCGSEVSSQSGVVVSGKGICVCN
jgi:hypothetical protein